MNSMTLLSGLTIDRPLDRLLKFCREEYEFYDATPDPDPNSFGLLDVLITAVVNSRVDTADKIRGVVRGFLALDSRLLKAIPIGASLESDDWPRTNVERLLAESMLIRGVKLSVATKVLHRKRPNLIPMLDSVLVDHYLDAYPRRGWGAELEDTKRKRRSAHAAIEIMDRFRSDLVESRQDIISLVQMIEAEGFKLTTVRILEVLIWMQRAKKYPID